MSGSSSSLAPVLRGQDREPLTRDMPFGVFCQVLENINTRHKHAEKIRVLDAFFRRYHDDDMYAVIRLLLPELDKERNVYGLKEQTLIKYFRDIFNLSDTNPDYNRMKNYRVPGRCGRSMGTGDFPVVASLALQNRLPSADQATATLARVNGFLDDLNSHAESKDKKRILLNIVQNVSGEQLKWILRIILKEMRLGIRHEPILKFYHDDALDYYNACSDLKKVVNELRDPNQRHRACDIKLGQPVKPMLASRRDPDDVEKIMEGQEFAIETKFDGERIQVHRDGDKVEIFSRKATVYSNLYQALAPFIRRYVLAQRCILDGELLVWDEEFQRFEGFGGLKTVALGGSNEGKHLCYVVFDILLVNDDIVMEMTLDQRREILTRIIRPLEKRLELADQQRARRKQDVTRAIDAAIEQGDEGVIVKDLKSAYAPGERKNHWLKFKPEYMDEDGGTMDLVIIGGYYGEGRRRTEMISHFLCAVALPPSGGGTSDKCKFHSICRVGSGYKVNEARNLNAELKDKWIRWNPARIPEFADGWIPGAGERPDVWIEPKHSKILEVVAGEITPSDKYKAGYTLRFPRVVRIRHDKPFDQCMTYSELVDAVHSGRGRSRVRGGIKSSPQKRARLAPSRGQMVLPQFRDTDTSHVAQETSIFKGIEFCVMGTEAGHTKRRVEELIVGHGGTKVQNPRAGRTQYIVTGKHPVTGSLPLKVRNEIHRIGTRDVISSHYILDCAGAALLLPFHHKYLFFVTPGTQKRLQKELDPFGDSYLIDATLDTVKSVASGALNEVPCPVLDGRSHLLDFRSDFSDDEIDDLRTSGDIFFGCVVYVDQFLVVGDSSCRVPGTLMDLVALDLQFYGGKVLDTLAPDTTHVVVNRADLDRLPEIRAQLRILREEGYRERHVVSRNWVEDSIACKTRLYERNYVIGRYAARPSL